MLEPEAAPGERAVGDYPSEASLKCRAVGAGVGVERPTCPRHIGRMTPQPYGTRAGRGHREAHNRLLCATCGDQLAQTAMSRTGDGMAQPINPRLLTNADDTYIGVFSQVTRSGAGRDRLGDGEGYIPSVGMVHTKRRTLQHEDRVQPKGLNMGQDGGHILEDAAMVGVRKPDGQHDPYLGQMALNGLQDLGNEGGGVGTVDRLEGPVVEREHVELKVLQPAFSEAIPRRPCERIRAKAAAEGHVADGVELRLTGCGPTVELHAKPSVGVVTLGGGDECANRLWEHRLGWGT